MLHSVQVVRMGAVIALWLCSFVSVGFAQGKTCEQCHPDANFKLDASPQHHTLATIHQGDWSKKGADTCLKCHDEDNEVPVVPIFQTKHGRAADPASPFAGLQCEACHGPGEAHAQKTKRGEPRAPIINFGKKSKQSVAEQNSQCLTCHQGDQRMRWRGSAHERSEVACASCHVIHAQQDPALDPRGQTQLCVQCHSQQRADLLKASTHPLRQGKMNCSSCHQAHGSGHAAELKRATTNQTCHDCHAEKRGPFLWQHAPVDEDCGLCHQPHGSNHQDMLVTRTALICRQCHSAAGHPSIAPSATALPGAQHEAFGRFLVGKSCLNCHAKIHGSNHPAGVKLLR